MTTPEVLSLDAVTPQNFPAGTTVTYNWTLNGVAAGSGESVTVDLVEGDNVILLDQVDANGKALVPQLSHTENIPVPLPVTVSLNIAGGIKVTPVATHAVDPATNVATPAAPADATVAVVTPPADVPATHAVDDAGVVTPAAPDAATVIVVPATPAV